MAIELKMPALSPTMEKGTLAKWLIAPGDNVKSGDLLAEIETDKATMEFEAVEEGRISELLIPEGSEDVPVGTVIAMLAEEGEAVAAPAMAGVDAQDMQADMATPPPAPERAIPEKRVPDAAPQHDPIPPEVRDISASVTPLARRIAAIKGIALTDIAGSGPHGKITKGDLGLPPIAAQSTSNPANTGVVATVPAVIAPPPEGVPLETVKLSSMRKTIARRLTESKQQVPHFYLTARCNLDSLLKLRKELNASLESRGIKLSVNDMVLKAMALALVAVPEANVQYGGDVLHKFGRVDVSMAVAIDGGLITPVVRNVDALSLSAIAETSRTLALKAREGKLQPEDYQGGTVSLSNLGMFGIDEMFPVINPPQGLILGVGAGVEQPWKVDGELALATIMSATASFDHRAIDGAVAAQFMAAFREVIESPLRIVG